MSKVIASSSSHHRRFFHLPSQQPQPVPLEEQQTPLNHLQHTAAVAMIGLQQLQQVASQMNSTANELSKTSSSSLSHPSSSSKNKGQMEEKKSKTNKTKGIEKKHHSHNDKDIREGDLIFVKLDGCPYWPAKVISPHAPHIPKAIREEILEQMDEEDTNTTLIEFFGDDKSKYYCMDKVVEIYTKNADVITEKMTRKNKKLAEAMRQALLYAQSEELLDDNSLQNRRQSFSGNNLTISTKNDKKRKVSPVSSSNGNKKKKVISDDDDDEANSIEIVLSDNDSLSDDNELRPTNNSHHDEEEEYSFSDEEERESPSKANENRSETNLSQAIRTLAIHCCGNPKLDKKFFEDWLCGDCKVCGVCESATCKSSPNITEDSQIASRLRICSKCDSAFHINCLENEGAFVLYKETFTCPDCTEKKSEWLRRRGEHDATFENYLFTTSKGVLDSVTLDFVLNNNDDAEDSDIMASTDDDQSDSEDKPMTSKGNKRASSSSPATINHNTITNAATTTSYSSFVDNISTDSGNTSPTTKKSPKSGRATKKKLCSHEHHQSHQSSESPKNSSISHPHSSMSADMPHSPPPHRVFDQSSSSSFEIHPSTTQYLKTEFGPNERSQSHSATSPSSALNSCSGKSRKATKVKPRGGGDASSSESSGNLHPPSSVSSPLKEDTIPSPTSMSPTTSSPSSSNGDTPSQELITLFIKCFVDGNKTDYTKRVRVSSHIDISQLKSITKSIVLKMKKSTKLDNHKIYLKNIDRHGHEVLLDLDEDFFLHDRLQNSDVLVLKM
ncbi:hypothetical protein FDP41_012448 [Naegleria fowleri]|uniref:PWWP domain-containing protein n=1 Tax=Naegleria fowleri TaxID=5763 RepID=A0A6A5C3Z1_NAEFO|nr:uncharacterized protein FDP41_012448 [Naegleria fowleri]KAF0981791.1 hypothetical protein FDP41_012448 [Naegleria fowleri]